MSAQPISLDDKYALNKTRAYITGIESLVRLPILQHQRDQERNLNTAGFISGYRGSPVGSLDQALWKAQAYLDRHDIRFVPGINEDLAATAVLGSQQVNLFGDASYDGVFGMWYGKGPGVDRSMDAIRHANAFGTSRYGGVLAIAGDDHAAKSSSLPHQSEHMFIGASIPVLNPANVQEILDLGIFGWELSRYCGAWVALKAITENMDSAISADIDPNRVEIALPEDFILPDDGVHIRWPDNALDQEIRLNKFKIYAAREFCRVNHLNKIVIDSAQPELGIITTGKAYLDVMQALEDLGITRHKAGALGLRVFKVGMSWPLEPVSTHEFATGLKEILVVEEKRSIIEDQLTSQLYNWPVEQRPRVVGEFDEQGKDLLPNLSELTPAMVARVIARRISRYYQDSIIEQRLAFYTRKEQTLAEPGNKPFRTPHYCSGCPHSTSTRIPEGSRSLGGIGCHYMGTWEEGDRKAYTYTQMGGEGVTWVGQAPFTNTSHVFQNLGDGTYFHSGLLAIRQTITSGVNITYKILYNDAVAMTGGQSIDGDLSVERMITQLRGEGVNRIALVAEDPEKHGTLPRFKGLTIDHRDNLITIEKELREIKGTTVLIFDQTCAAEKRRRRKRGELSDPDVRVIINPEICEGCGDCNVQSNCLSVLPLDTELGLKRQIDQHACNKDYSCLKGFCPSFVTVSGGQLRQHVMPVNAEFPVLPEPELASIDEQSWNIVVTGTGGTGVLTVAALIAMAAHIEGKGCTTMNQTGLAQKFGTVVSHVRIARSQEAIKAVRIAAGDADLLLGCDLVVASCDDAIGKLNNTRSSAVINDHAAVTAAFIHDRESVIPVDSLKEYIAHEVVAGKTYFVDATRIASHIMGDPIASNLFLSGYACQMGLLPVLASSIYAAIELNGVAVTFNQQAFEWGRRTAFDKQRVVQVAGIKPEFHPLTDLDEIIEDRRRRLIDYQSEDYANRYLTWVNRIRKVDATIDHGIQSLTRETARYLYKLMAFKDEYEVARLYANGEFKAYLDSVLQGDYRLEFHLAPPFLSGRDNRKWKFPSLLMIVFALLAKLKFSRGTWFDPFRYTGERKLERRLIADYENLLVKILGCLSDWNYETAVELVSLPDLIRGFGHVKAAGVERFYDRKARLMQQLGRQRKNLVAVKEVTS